MSTVHVDYTCGPWHVSPPTAQNPSRAMVTALSGFVEIYNAPLTSETAANARLIAAAPDLLQMLRDVDAHFAAHFGEQAWATSEIGGMTRVCIAKAIGGGA